MKIHYLIDRWRWFGNHTGYDQFIKYINVKKKITVTKETYPRKIIGKIYSVIKGWKRNNYYSFSELSFKIKYQQNNIKHILYYDTHYFLWNKKIPKSVTTIHHPNNRKMDVKMFENLKNVEHLIVLNSKDKKKYEKYVKNVYFIRHGVNIDFFKPKKLEFTTQKRIFYTGQNGRDTLQLYRVINELHKKNKNLVFDLLVRVELRNIEGLKELQNKPYIILHENVSDNNLLRLYQNAYLLLLPLKDCSANNAIVEAMACGTPVVTNNVGGIRDYGGGNVYPVANSDEDIIQLVEKYVSNEEYRNKIGEKCREFAIKNLDWRIIAQKHLEVYKKIQ